MANKKKASRASSSSKPKRKKTAPARPAAAKSKTAKETALEKLNQQQHGNSKFQSVILFACAVLFFLVSFIQGSAGWKFLHCVVRGIFGFSFLLVPFILLLSAYRTEKQSNTPLLRRFLYDLLLTVIVSSFVQIIFVGDIEKKNFIRAISYLYRTGVENAFQSGGVISAILAYPLIRILGATGARITIVILLFLAIMKFLDLSMSQLWGYIRLPFRKLRELWNRDAEWAEDAAPEEEPAEEPEVFLPQEPQPPMPRRAAAQPDPVFPEPPAAAPAPEAQPDFSSELEAMIRDSRPQEGEPYDMDIDLPIPTDGDTAGIVTPEEWSAAPPELAKAEKQAESAGAPELAVPQSAVLQKPYQIPPMDFLQPGISRANDPAAEQELKEKAGILVDTLNSFGVTVRITGISRGPSVTRYEIQSAAGVKVSKITGLADDIALSLAAQGVRIEAPIPGKPAIGIEVPNSHKDTVSLREILESDNFRNASSKLAFAVGRDIAGNCIVGDIARLPHMIIAGATGSGKSVCTNSIIMSILYHASPDEVKLILIDPKIVEFTVYEGIPHLLIPVVTDPKKAAGALQWAVFEMMKRYKMFSEKGVKDLAGYNALSETDEDVKKLPTVVVVIDELADLMLVAAKEVEESICRVAQMGRAAGMHLVIATQRPSADVITGLMKANIPSRIAFAVASSMESRIILDTTGAEKLVGKGDMLYFPLGDTKPTRVQGCFITPEEIDRVVKFVKDEAGEAHYDQDVIEKIQQAVDAKADKGGKVPSGDVSDDGDDADELLSAAVEVVLETGQASVSMLQRRLKLGYSRAARLVDQMEERGYVGPFEGSKPRQLLITKEQWQELKMKGAYGATPPEAEELPPPDEEN